jgi:hypothetical protein
MLRKTVLSLGVALIGTVLAGASFAMWFDVSALPEPTGVETYIATKGKQWLVYRESRTAELHEPSATCLSSAGLTFQGDMCDVSRI